MRTLACLLVVGCLMGCGDDGTDDDGKDDDKSGDCTEDGSETFELTLDAMWSSTSHPTDFPGGAHFSALIGATHNSSVHLWKNGEVASGGIEVMAESGGTSTLRTEIESLIQAGDGCGVVTGSGISSGTGSATVMFTTNADFPRISITTMIAPSPDWFIGVDSFALRNADDSPQVEDSWIDEATVDLFAYDAGSDDGAIFSPADPDIDTSPKEAISRLTGGDFDVKFGTLTIRRQ